MLHEAPIFSDVTLRPWL